MTDEVKRFLSELGKKRWENKTPEEKKAHAMMMVEKKRKKALDKPTTTG